jgi:hypothetical protein
MRAKLILLLLIITPAVMAAHWEEVELKHNWDRTSHGYCIQESQCLVRESYNESLDNQPDTYWTGTAYADRPKCIQDKQYLSDYYCENGEWSSRTKLIAQQLLKIAGTNDFALYCDKYQNVLNEYQYNTDYGTVTTFLGKYCSQPGNRRTENCVNNICVIKYADKVAFGTAINTNISSDESPLQALNYSKTKCDGKTNSGYNPCGDYVYYNPDIQSIIYAPEVSPMPAVTQTEIDYVEDSYEKLKDYTYDYVYDITVKAYNHTHYKVTPLFQYIYITKDGEDFFYGFKQENISQPSTSYAGWYYSNIELPDQACDRYIKRYDSRANCEEQPSDTEFYIVAYKSDPKDKHVSIIDAWQDMTGKLRIFK